MMRIRIRQSLYRDRYGVEHRAGDIAELPDHVGVKLIGYGIAEAVREDRVEAETVAPPEDVAKRPAKNKTSKRAAPTKREVSDE